MGDGKPKGMAKPNALHHAKGEKSKGKKEDLACPSWGHFSAWAIAQGECANTFLTAFFSAKQGERCTPTHGPSRAVLR